MGRDPGPKRPNGPGPGPKWVKWAGTRAQMEQMGRDLAQWIQTGRDPGPKGFRVCIHTPAAAMEEKKLPLRLPGLSPPLI